MTIDDMIDVMSIFVIKRDINTSMLKYTIEEIQRYFLTSSYDFLKLTCTHRLKYRIEGFRNGRFIYLTFIRIKDVTKKKVFLQNETYL